eukprot:TRINITY_DN937_c0_g2_i3.p1 TRINITY_DN937_c0_g2~~TRINITY_DN937_c0_g2_i3.p1  ORF type:complete len:376 (+),score=88.19 TRINITY_DN937_c0_g2_i3:81-1208(+)
MASFRPFNPRLQSVHFSVKAKFEAQMEEAVAEFQQRENELMDQLKSSKDALMQLHSLHDNVQSQLFTLRSQQGLFFVPSLLSLMSRVERVSVAKDSEHSMLFEELERSQSTIMSLRRENEALLTQLNHAKNRNVVSDVHELDKFRALEEKPDASIRNHGLVSAELESARRAADAEIQQLEANLVAKQFELEETKNQIKELELKIQELPFKEDYEKLKRRLHALQAVQFNDVDADFSDESAGIEKVFIQKNCHLEAELVRLKLDLTNSDANIESLESELSSVSDVLEKNRALVTKLEQDLERYTSLNAVSTQTLLHGADSSAEQSRFDIVVGQRDRYRKRVETLESVSANMTILYFSPIFSRFIRSKLACRVRLIG